MKEAANWGGLLRPFGVCYNAGMLHALAVGVIGLFFSLVGVLSIFLLFIPGLNGPTARDQQGANEAMAEYVKRQRKRLRVNKDKAAKSLPESK
jgi:competence protein ComGC